MILAKGKIAKKPYELSYLGQNIYSIEELCYVIYHNIYGINEEFFQISLAKWMKEELGLKELAEKLEAMIVGEHGLKDLVVTTLCGCDYYNEEEIRGIVKVLDEIDHLPSYQKKKIKADNYVRTGHYGKAVMAYRKLLQGPDAISFTPEEYGDILHNEGIAHFYTSSFLEAGEDFRSASAAVAMVMDILVPVSPSGTGNTLRSLMACFWAVMAAAPCRTICLKSAPVISLLILQPSSSQDHGIYEHVHSADLRAGVLIHHVAYLIHNGAAHCGNIDAVFHDDVEFNGNGLVLVVDHVDTLAHGFPPQQVNQTVRHGAVGHALHAEAVGGGHAGDVGKNSAGDGNLALF